MRSLTLFPYFLINIGILLHCMVSAQEIQIELPNDILSFDDNDNVDRQLYVTDCDASAIIGQTLFFSDKKGFFCYKLELFPGGLFGRSRGIDCTSPDFTLDEVFSEYRRYDSKSIFWKRKPTFNFLGRLDIRSDSRRIEFFPIVKEFSFERQFFYIVVYFPSCPTAETALPTIMPTEQPSVAVYTIDASPSLSPTTASEEPSLTPSLPTNNTQEPTKSPTPTLTPSAEPSTEPTETRSMMPTITPSVAPSTSTEPSEFESTEPSTLPSLTHSDVPTVEGSLKPSELPSAEPTMTPSTEPTMTISLSPSAEASMTPSTLPTSVPSDIPSTIPSLSASEVPSATPSVSAEPTLIHSSEPTIEPTSSRIPTIEPSIEPTEVPFTLEPTFIKHHISGCDARERIGKTLLFTKEDDEDNCYKLELFTGGVLGYAPSSSVNCTDPNFIPSVILSHFDFADDYDGIYFQRKEDGVMAGYVKFVEDTQISTGEIVEIKKYDLLSKTFIMEVTVQTCKVPSVTVAVGFEHVCLLVVEQYLTCWGKNEYGQLGSTTATSSSSSSGLSSSVDVEIDGATQVVAGYQHTCAVTNDKAMMCWGRNNHGQVGDSSNTNRLSPVTIFEGKSSSFSSVRQASAGGFHTCALMEGGKSSVLCWGNNKYGQLGDKSTISKNTPVEVQLNDVAIQIVSGYTHSCALMANKSISCWGRNNHKQLGRACKNSFCDTPVPVFKINNAIQIAAGSWHTCALLEDKTVMCWGNNQYGQIGDGTTQSKSWPTPVSNIKKVEKLTLGIFHSCGLKEDGSVKCWGSNLNGELADGSFKNRYIPTQATIFDKSVHHLYLSPVSHHNFAMMVDRSIHFWGSYDSDIERNIPRLP